MGAMGNASVLNGWRDAGTNSLIKSFVICLIALILLSIRPAAQTDVWVVSWTASAHGPYPSGNPVGGWRPQERVSFAHALAGFTRDAAYAGFAESRIGSLDPGKHADFILVDRDVSKVSPVDLAATRVLETWVDGRKVWASAPGSRAR